MATLARKAVKLLHLRLERITRLPSVACVAAVQGKRRKVSRPPWKCLRAAEEARCAEAEERRDEVRRQETAALQQAMTTQQSMILEFLRAAEEGRCADREHQAAKEEVDRKDRMEDRKQWYELMRETMGGRG